MKKACIDIDIDDVRLIAPRDPGYQAFLRRLHSERQQRRAQNALSAGLCDDAPLLSVERAPLALSVQNEHAPSAGRCEDAHPISVSVAVTPVDYPEHAQNSARTDSEKTMNRPETRTDTPAEDATPPQRIGKLVERVARFWLAQYMKLEQNTILTWRERTCEKWNRHYAELDAVHRVDYDVVLVAEVKHISELAMRSGKGRYQLERAARLLQTTRSGRRVLQRLVYIGNGNLVLPGIAPVPPEDREIPFGVIWIPASELEALAIRHDIPLPAHWHTAPCADTPSDPVATGSRTPAFYMCA